MTLSDTFRTCLGIEKDESVLLLTDTEMEPVAQVIFNALTPLSDEVMTLSIRPREMHGEELPRGAAEAMAASAVVIGATSRSMTHTQATRDAVESGARVASMPGVTVGMLTKGGMTADYNEVAHVALKVAGILTQGKTIAIKTGQGTDFKANISGRKGRADTGLLTRKGEYGNLPGGEGFIAPLEGSSEGRIVFDGPIASSGLSHKPITVDVKNGMAAYTNYNALEEVFNEIEGASQVGEIGIGVNPRARLTGNILEDEKVLGTAHIAFGNNENFGGRITAKAHLDGIIREPTLSVDGKTVLKEGRLIL